VIVAIALAIAALLTCPSGVAAADNPNGRTIFEVIPVGNRLRTADQIRAFMVSRPGIPYEEVHVQEDVRKLHATKWFVPGGVQVSTRIEADGRVTILVYVNELPGIVEDLQFIGAQHLSRNELQDITGIRKGEPMNPSANEYGRATLQRRYQDDGRYYAQVELLEGNKPTDTRVIFSIVEGPTVKVAGVDFRGVQHASTGRLRTQIATKREFLKFFGGKFQPVSMDIDRRELINYYESIGFIDVQITPEVVQAADVGHVRIVYHIVEGKQYTVEGKQINGAKSFPLEALNPLTDDLKPGEKYDRRISEGNKSRLRDYYGSRGYEVGIKEERYANPEKPGVIQVHYDVMNDRGVPDRVGRIILDGNDITKDRVILNQLDLRPGQILQYPKIEEARMRLARLGVFDPEVPPTVEVIPNEFDSTFKDIRVRVKETRTGSFQFGGSFNTDQGVTGNITLNERNFDILRWPTSLDDIRNGRAFRGGGQEFRIEAAPGTAFQRYSATWREPYLLDTPFGLTVSGYYFQRSFAEYNEDRVGGRFTLDRRLDPIWRASLAMRVEGVAVKDVPANAPASISRDAGQHFVLGLRPGLTRDTRDSYLYPTTGSVLDIGFEQLLGSYTVPIGTVEYTKFLSTKYLAREDGSGKHVLGIRSQFSVAGDDAPVFERFYGGGIRSFRGFTFRGLGPFENNYAVGGRFAFINTIEYQIPILANDKFHFVTFCDHGTVEKNFAIRDYRVSVGAGFRLAIPALGPLPLAIDFGFPLSKGPNDKGQTVNVSVGLFGN